MPEPLPPLPHWSGVYDDPPASESSTPWTRRNRLQRALHSTSDLAQESVNMSGVERGIVPPFRRRRRRLSDPDDDSANAAPLLPEHDSFGRRPKRRRLDHAGVDHIRPAIKYGYYGQVESGRLRMELLSCDGGEHMDSRHPNVYLGPKNVLQNDKSVYCSERSSTNLVLVHADYTAFCLEKLHIIGPEHGFTAPVREGLVYVAMNVADLQPYVDPPHHARLQGVHSPPYRQRRNAFRATIHSSPERLSFSDALRDPEVNAALDQTRQQDEVRLISPDAGSTPVPLFTFDRSPPAPDLICEPPVASSESLEDVTDSIPPVTFLVDEDEGPEETSSQDVLNFRLQRLRLMRRHIIDDWAREDRRHDSAFAEEFASGSNAERLNRSGAYTYYHDNPPLADYMPYGPPGRVAAMGAGVEEGMKDDKVTCARFQIRKGKYKLTIKFDPPISGRVILLKLWAGRSNVDVQSVIAKGYGSLRFFPAKELR